MVCGEFAVFGVDDEIVVVAVVNAVGDGGFEDRRGMRLDIHGQRREQRHRVELCLVGEPDRTVEGERHVEIVDGIGVEACRSCGLEFGTHRRYFVLGLSVGEGRHPLDGQRVFLAVPQQPLLSGAIGFDVLGHRAIGMPRGDALRASSLEQADLSGGCAGRACPETSTLDHRHLDAALGK